MLKHGAHTIRQTDLGIFEYSFHFEEDGEPEQFTFNVSAHGDLEQSLDELMAYAVAWVRSCKREGWARKSVYACAFKKHISLLQMEKEKYGARIAKKQNTVPENRTAEEVEKTRELLIKGRRLDGIATRLGRSGDSIRYRLTKASTLRALLKPPTTGKWGSHEFQHLIQLRKQSLKPSVIAKRMGRTKYGVNKQLSRVAHQICNDDKPSVFQGPQALPPELEDSIIQGRLQELWKGLIRLEMTETWMRVLSRKMTEAWQSLILKSIPTEVKKLLASHQPPTVAKLEALPWIETNTIGVYGWLLKPRTKPYLNKECQLYVGSASRYGCGLNLRRSQLLSKEKNKYNRWLRHLITRRKLARQGHFITLFNVEMTSSESENIRNVRHVVVLAKALFATWLGIPLETPWNLPLRVKSKAEDECRRLCPWDIGEVSYSACLPYNPDTGNVRAQTPTRRQRRK